MSTCFTTLLLLALFSLVWTVAESAPAPEAPKSSLEVTIVPAGTGRQLVRASLPFLEGALMEGQGLAARDGKRATMAAVRILTYYPAKEGTQKSARRAIVTFPYTFAKQEPVRFTLQPRKAESKDAPRLPVSVKVEKSTVTLNYKGGVTFAATLLAPARTATEEPIVETVESNPYFLWQRYRLNDPRWPRIIEVRADALGGVAVIAHLQRNLTGDGYAPDFGWKIATSLPLDPASDLTKPTDIRLRGGKYHISHPTEPFTQRGSAQALASSSEESGYLYYRCKETQKVPMQQASWRKAEFVAQPAGLAAMTPTLEYPHVAQVDWKLWDALYGIGPPLDLSAEPELAALLRYHHDATARCALRGDDWGNITGYADGSETGGVFGMNRLNHGPPIFWEAYRSGDRRLRDTALLWCENFYDLSIWWGPEGTGGTRYNNVVALGQKPPENEKYMWRSNRAVSFCTKGYDAFFMAYEETGDPRMKEALKAQADYAEQNVHAGANYCRNVGDVRDSLNLYRFTGEQRYLEESLRLFRELRTQLSTGDLFTESGQPIVADPPYIDDDRVGPKYPYAKPYIIGYGLSGLPDLALLTPEEPKLKEVVRAVADFMAESQDPVGGWRYPHPRSSYVIISQAMEHAWQLAQAGKLTGARSHHLDAIERVLRQRYWGWKKTGKMFGGLAGWELATGKIKQQSEIYDLYMRPQDRDFTRDYIEGRPDFGGSSPEGIVYFPEVLAYYLQHRPASRLTAPPKANDPLGKTLARVPSR